MLKFTKLIKTFIYLLLVVLLISCSKEEACGEETSAEIEIANYNDFSNINRYFTEEANFFSYYYYSPLDSMSQDSSVRWVFNTEFKNICTSDKPKIDFLLLLNNPDTSVSVIGGIQETINLVQFEPIVASQDGTNYLSTIEYKLKGNYARSATIIVSLTIRFKSKGSFSADKDYFFSNLDVMATRIIAHKPK